MDKQNKATKKKLIAQIIAVVVLSIMLVITTFALALSMVSVDDNLFETSQVKVELNDGKTIFDGTDMNIEPGHSLVRNFTVENSGAVDIYVRLYLENVTGSLQEALNFSIYDGDTLLFSGNAKDLTKQTPCVSDIPLKRGEKRVLTAVVKMEESAGNSYQNGGIAFDMTADAVQVRNNPTKEFD